jgi:flagellar hook-basal body complex protein FliE
MATAPILNVAFPAAGAVKNQAFQPSGVGTPKVNGQSFSELMRQVATEGVDRSTTSEIQSTKSLNKSTDIVDVVTAVTNAEVTLQTAVAVRDRIIQAYQSIIRMPV